MPSPRVAIDLLRWCNKCQRVVMLETCYRCNAATVPYAGQDGATMVRCPPAMTVAPSQPKPATRQPRQSKGPNKAEAEYRDKHLPYDSIYEGLRIKLPGGHWYTPDWATVGADGLTTCVEVKVRGKNGFRQPSYQRARLAFDQARELWPEWRFVWAERRDDKGGAWEVEE